MNDKLFEKKALVAMSGGVDSSVAAANLVEDGFGVEGVAMRVYNERDFEGCAVATCCSSDDFLDAFRVAERLGFPFTVKDLRREFTREVIEPFVAEYLRGRTPNPCVLCNNRLKFYYLFQVADSMGAKYIATGHYARIKRGEEGLFRLYRGVDRAKDQSYFLFGLTQSQLERTLFPVGEITKEEARAKARRLGLPTASKRESQEVCFIPDNRTGKFVADYAGMKKTEGEIVNLEGRVIGRHKGIMYYTVGQRQGLGIAHKNPLYVLKIDVANNRLIVGENEELLAYGAKAADVNYPSGLLPKAGEECEAQIRYRHSGVKAIITEATADRIAVEFKEGARAVTPGQALVLYRGEECIGGGWIE